MTACFDFSPKKSKFKNPNWARFLKGGAHLPPTPPPPPRFPTFVSWGLSHDWHLFSRRITNPVVFRLFWQTLKRSFQKLLFAQCVILWSESYYDRELTPFWEKASEVYHGTPHTCPWFYAPLHCYFSNFWNFAGAICFLVIAATKNNQTSNAKTLGWTVLLDIQSRTEGSKAFPTFVKLTWLRETFHSDNGIVTKNSCLTRHHNLNNYLLRSPR